MHKTTDSFEDHICKHLEAIYNSGTEARLFPDSLGAFALQLMEIMRIGEQVSVAFSQQNHWDERDVILISYGDTVVSDNKSPLKELHNFLNTYCREVFNSVHILPFFPFSSDDGFSVIDYREVNEELGTWEDVETIAKDYRLMADLVINHCSSRSLWFQNFIKGEGEGRDFFVTADPEDDLSLVVRPRTSPLLRQTETGSGKRHVWCTFSHDQVDLDFSNPEVLSTFVAIIRQYLDHGVRLFRLDAVAFLWKEVGTCCINLPQTHEIVRLLRCLIEHAVPDAVVITETNIPTIENLSYFGEANEANWVYNFPLPPLLVDCLLRGDSRHLRRWSMAMPPAQNGTAYFNFIASHDGIGLRPVEGILDHSEVEILVETMEAFGGRISWRSVEGGAAKPYEINISLYDALQGRHDGGGIKKADKWWIDRFLCAHAIMFALEGIPGVYVHSLLGTSNDYEKLALTGHNRAINRHQWQADHLYEELGQIASRHRIVLDGLKALLKIRVRQPAFHPNATQFTLRLGDTLFGLWRQSVDRSQSIFAVSNVTAEEQELALENINLIESQIWRDLLDDRELVFSEEVLVLAPYQTVWISNR